MLEESKPKKSSKAKTTNEEEKAPKVAALSASALDGIFSKQAKTKEKKTTKQTKKLDPKFSNEFDVTIAGKKVIKAVQTKVEVAESRLKDHFIRNWASDFVKTKALPASSCYVDGNNSLDFISTRKIFLKPAQMDELKAIGIDPDNFKDKYAEETGYDMNLANLNEALQEKVILAVANTLVANGVDPEEITNYVTRKMSAKDNLYSDLEKIARSSLGSKATENQVIDQLVNVVKILKPVQYTQNPQVDESLEDSLTRVLDTDIDITPEEEKAAQNKRRFNLD